MIILVHVIILDIMKVINVIAENAIIVAKVAKRHLPQINVKHVTDQKKEQ